MAGRQIVGQAMRTLILTCVLLLPAMPTRAQSDDVQAVLAEIISALQTGGPNRAFQWLTPKLRHEILRETGGTGRDPRLVRLGQIDDVQLTGTQRIPGGSIYSARVQHRGGVSMWRITYDSYANIITRLRFDSRSERPPVAAPPALPPAPVIVPPTIIVVTPPAGSAPPVATVPPGSGEPAGDGGDGCRLYPEMC